MTAANSTVTAYSAVFFLIVLCIERIFSVVRSVSDRLPLLYRLLLNKSTFFHRIKKAPAQFRANALTKTNFDLISLVGSAFDYIAVCTMYGVVTCIFIPIIAFFNSVPLRYCTVIYDSRKTTATVERLIVDTRYAVWYGYTC